MAIYRVGQELELNVKINMRIIRAFAVEDAIYYIVHIPKTDKIKNQEQTPLYGVFRHDDTAGIIPVEISQIAADLVTKENLLEGLS